MRIGFEVTSLYAPRGGVGTYTLNLLEHLRALGQDQVVPLAHGLSFKQALTHTEWNTFELDGQRKPWMNKTLWMQAVLPVLLRYLDIDICHFTNAIASLWAPCPSVVTIHDMTLWMFPQYHYRRRLLAMRPFVPVAVQRAAAVIAVSEATKADVLRILGLPESRVHVVYEAPSPVFQPVESGAWLQEVRQRYRLPERFLLYVGTIEPRKNLVRLMEALAQLRRTNGAGHVLIVVGNRGWKDQAVFATVNRLELEDAVRFLGYLPEADLVGLYNLAEAVAFPSLYEGFGLPVLEAMACGTAVIASPNGSLQEVAGDAAQFIDPSDVDSIAEGLRRVLLDEDWRKELERRGRARAAQFTWLDAAAQTRELYSLAASTRGSPDKGFAGD